MPGKSTCCGKTRPLSANAAEATGRYRRWSAMWHYAGLYRHLLPADPAEWLRSGA